MAFHAPYRVLKVYRKRYNQVPRIDEGINHIMGLQESEELNRIINQLTLSDVKKSSLKTHAQFTQIPVHPISQRGGRFHPETQSYQLYHQPYGRFGRIHQASYDHVLR